MEYNPNSLFDDLLRCFNIAENKNITRAERIAGLIEAYDLLRDMDKKWETISEQDKGKAIFYWRVFIRPEAERYGIILDGGEPKYTRKTSHIGKRERKL